MATDPTAEVRLLTGLTADELADADIDTWLAINGDSTRLAAADALEAFAGTLVDIQSVDLTLTGSRRATTLLARAAQLREQATAMGEGPDEFAFDVVYPTRRRPELTERPAW